MASKASAAPPDCAGETPQPILRWSRRIWRKPAPPSAVVTRCWGGGKENGPSSFYCDPAGHSTCSWLGEWREKKSYSFSADDEKNLCTWTDDCALSSCAAQNIFFPWFCTFVHDELILVLVGTKKKKTFLMSSSCLPLTQPRRSIQLHHKGSSTNTHPWREIFAYTRFPLNWKNFKPSAFYRSRRFDSLSKKAEDTETAGSIFSLSWLHGSFFFFFVVAYTQWRQCLCFFLYSVRP